MSKYQTIAFIGFGEAAQAFCEGWGDRPLLTVRAYDVKTGDDTTADAKRGDYLHYGLVGCETALDAIQQAEAVISVVTADQALAAARNVAAGIAPGTFFFDCNSVAPATKQAAAEAIMTAGGCYVDVAVMSPVRPALLAVPLLLSGPFAAEGERLLADLGFCGRVVEGGVGAASAIKMIRSIMIKGLEALSAECLLSAAPRGSRRKCSLLSTPVFPVGTGAAGLTTISTACLFTAFAAPPKCGNPQRPRPNSVRRA